MAASRLADDARIRGDAKPPSSLSVLTAATSSCTPRWTTAGSYRIQSQAATFWRLGLWPMTALELSVCGVLLVVNALQGRCLQSLSPAPNHTEVPNQSALWRGRPVPQDAHPSSLLSRTRGPTFRGLGPKNGQCLQQGWSVGQATLPAIRITKAQYYSLPRAFKSTPVLLSLSPPVFIIALPM
jgi:hypothetical protein